jgi:hypothetical protein
MEYVKDAGVLVVSFVIGSAVNMGLIQIGQAIIPTPKGCVQFG